MSPSPTTTSNILSWYTELDRTLTHTGRPIVVEPCWDCCSCWVNMLALISRSHCPCAACWACCSGQTKRVGAPKKASCNTGQNDRMANTTLCTDSAHVSGRATQVSTFKSKACCLVWVCCGLLVGSSSIGSSAQRTELEEQGKTSFELLAKVKAALATRLPLQTVG